MDEENSKDQIPRKLAHQLPISLKSTLWSLSCSVWHGRLLWFS